MGWETVVIGLGGSLTTLAAGLGAPLINGRIERERRRIERRSALYVELVADAMQRRGNQEDWADTYPGGAYGEEPLRNRSWKLLGSSELVVKAAELELFGESSMRVAWKAYSAALDRISWSGEVNGERDPDAEKDLNKAIDAVLGAGRRDGVP